MKAVYKQFDKEIEGLYYNFMHMDLDKEAHKIKSSLTLLKTFFSSLNSEVSKKSRADYFQKYLGPCKKALSEIEDFVHNLTEAKMKNILFVDDNDNFAYFMCEILKSHKHHVVRASNLKETEDLISNENKHFDVVVLDYMLGDKYSDELAKNIKSKTPNTYIIMMSGCTTIDFKYIQELLDSAVINSYISKPFEFQQLKKLIDIK